MTIKPIYGILDTIEVQSLQYKIFRTTELNTSL